MPDRLSQRPRAGWGRWIGKALVASPFVYLLASYLYWAMLKIWVTFIIGPFHFSDQCDVVHGGLPFWMVVILSPLTFPLHVAISIDPGDMRDTYVSWASDMAVEFAPFPKPLLAIGAAIMSAFAISIACVWCTYHILRKRRLSK